jgi:copper transport protein
MWLCGRRAALLSGALLCLMVTAAPASAHAVLVGSDPPDGAVLPGAPRTVQLRFSEDLAPRFSSARLVDGAGSPVAGVRVTARGSRVLVVELPSLRAGAYGVLWRVLASADGHTTGGAVVFNVGERSGPVPAALSDGAAGVVARPADVARRWVGVCLLAGLIGALAMVGLVLGRAGSAHPAGPLAVAIQAARRRLLSFALVCAALCMAVGVADATAQAAHQGPATGGWPATIVQLLAGTRWGLLWLVREGALLGLVLVTLRWRSTIDEPRRAGPPVLAAAAGVLVLTVVSVEAAGSHAAALEQARGAAVAADALHILTACLWLGALPALVLMTWPRRWGAAGPADLLTATRGSLSWLVAGSAALVVVTGLYSAGRQVDTVDGLTGTTYGRALLVKGTLLLVVGGLGLVNSARLHGRCPAWLGSVGSRLARAWPSRRLVAVEAGAGALLLVAVAVLVETAPAHGRAEPAPAPAAAETATGSVADLVVTVSATPNRPGLNGFTVLTGSSRRPPPAPVDAVTLQLAGGAGGSPAATGAGNVVALRQVAPGRWFGTGRLDQPGALRLEAQVQRGSQRLAVPLSWWVGPPASAQRVAVAPGRHLAPYADVIALSLLAGALALAWRQVVRTRRRRAASAARTPRSLPPPSHQASEVPQSERPPAREAPQLQTPGAREAPQLQTPGAQPSELRKRVFEEMR